MRRRPITIAAVSVLAVLLALAAVVAGNMNGATPAASFEPELRYAPIDGGRLAYYERGQGRPLLMNAGSNSTMSEWDPALLALLARQHRLIIYDYRGIGLSSGRGLRRLTIDRLADDALALLDSLGIERAGVLGWSLGGFVAQRVAVRHPARVSKLVLAATNPGGRATTFGPPRAQRIDSDPRASEREQLSVNFPPTAAGRSSARWFLRRVERAAEAGTIPDDFSVGRDGARAQLRAERGWYRSGANLTELRSLQMPALVATGRLDVLTPPANSRLIAARIAGARLELFRGGHAFLFQDRRRFARSVRRLGR